MAFNPAEEVRLAEEAKRIAAITNEMERDAALAKAAKATASPAEAFDHLNNQITALQQQSKHTLAADVESFNTPLGTVRTEIGAGFNGQGLTGGSASVFTGIMDNKLGAASVGVTGSMNGQGALGDPTVSARYVSPALIDSKDSRLEAVAIGAVGATIPTTNREFTGADVSIAAGGVVFDKPTGAAFTGLVSTDGTGKDPAVWGRLSVNVYEDANTRLAANLNGGYDTANAQGSVGAGLFVDHKIDATNKVYASAGVTINDVGGKKDVAGMFNLGATFDVMPAPKTAEKVASAPVLSDIPPNIISATAPTYAAAPAVSAPVAAPSQPEKAATYDFMELSTKDQQKVFAIMAKAYQKANPEVSNDQAQLAIASELNKAGYLVDSKGTRTFKDDMPAQAQEQVASR